MLLLTMNIGAERYGIDVHYISEIIPLVSFDRVPHVDACIRGLFNYRGTPVPVIDLCIFFENRTCNDSFGSRIIITQLDMGDGKNKFVGLLAEQVTEVIKCNPEEFTRNGIASEKSRFLQFICQHQNTMIQILDVPSIIPDSIKQQINRTETVLP